MKVYVEIDRGNDIETRGVDGTEADIREALASFTRQGPIVRVLNERGEDVSADWTRTTDVEEAHAAALAEEGRRVIDSLFRTGGAR